MRLGLLCDLHVVDERHAAGDAWHNPYDFAGVLERAAAALAAFAEEGVDAIAIGGDVVRDPGEADLAPLDRLLAGAAVPVLAVSGNHDGGGDALLAALPSVRGARPEGERIGGVRLAGIELAGTDWSGVRTAASAPAVEAWGEEPVVLLSHFPLLSHAARLSARGLAYPGDLLDRRPHAAAVAGRGAPTVVLSGHIHARDAQHRGALLQLTAAALVEPPYECTLVDVDPDGDGVAVRRRARSLPGPEPTGPLPVLSGADERFRWSIGRGWRRGS
jgi:hypothetical protein